MIFVRLKAHTQSLMRGKTPLALISCVVGLFILSPKIALAKNDALVELQNKYLLDLRSHLRGQLLLDKHSNLKLQTCLIALKEYHQKIDAQGTEQFDVLSEPLKIFSRFRLWSRNHSKDPELRVVAEKALGKDCIFELGQLGLSFRSHYIDIKNLRLQHHLFDQQSGNWRFLMRTLYRQRLLQENPSGAPSIFELPLEKIDFSHPHEAFIGDVVWPELTFSDSEFESFLGSQTDNSAELRGVPGMLVRSRDGDSVQRGVQPGSFNRLFMSLCEEQNESLKSLLKLEADLKSKLNELSKGRHGERRLQDKYLRLQEEISKSKEQLSLCEGRPQLRYNPERKSLYWEVQAKTNVSVDKLNFAFRGEVHGEFSEKIKSIYLEEVAEAPFLDLIGSANPSLKKLLSTFSGLVKFSGQTLRGFDKRFQRKPAPPNTNLTSMAPNLRPQVVLREDLLELMNFDHYIRDILELDESQIKNELDEDAEVVLSQNIEISEFRRKLAAKAGFKEIKNLGAELFLMVALEYGLCGGPVGGFVKKSAVKVLSKSLSLSPGAKEVIGLVLCHFAVNASFNAHAVQLSLKRHGEKYRKVFAGRAAAAPHLIRIRQSDFAKLDDSKQEIFINVLASPLGVGFWGNGIKKARTILETSKRLTDDVLESAKKALFSH